MAVGSTHGAGATCRRQEEEPAASTGVMSRQAKDDFLRHYTVSDPRTHPKGYTEYKVTAQVRWDPAGNITLLSSLGPVLYLKGKELQGGRSLAYTNRFPL